VDVGQAYGAKERSALRKIGISFYKVIMSSEKYEQWQHIIPGRNLIMLTAAADRVAAGGTIYFGVTSGEGWDSGKGDKSSKFVDKFVDWYAHRTGKLVTVEVNADKTKGQMLKEFQAAGYDLDIIRYKSVTCFSPTPLPCGQCQACLRKYLSFTSIGIETAHDYMMHPIIGGAKFVEKYKHVLSHALEVEDYSHYSQARCCEDLYALEKADVAVG
jgi:7-cyano-7-deazaguanine synthase in queuosine biosynthesis